MLRTKTFILPAHFASFLVNGDASSLSMDDVDEIELFKAKHNLLDCVDCSEDSWFSWRNDLNNLGGDVMEFTFEVGE
jgi:hypothetical protein